MTVEPFAHGWARTLRLPLVATAACVAVNAALADEGGVSFWLPGQFGSLAAVPGAPGFALPVVYYHASVDAGGSREPVGAYRAGRLANIGIGHWAWDVGGGYTYFDPKNGHEFSIVGGVTYNWENDDTDYQNGVDGHVDWAASQFLNEQLHVGVVGHFYYQLTGDKGSGAKLGSFKSRVNGIGPQVGYFFPVGKEKGYVNLKGYWEWDAKNRPEGWNLWVTAAVPLAALH